MAISISAKKLDFGTFNSGEVTTRKLYINVPIDNHQLPSYRWEMDHSWGSVSIRAFRKDQYELEITIDSNGLLCQHYQDNLLISIGADNFSCRINFQVQAERVIAPPPPPPRTVPPPLPRPVTNLPSYQYRPRYTPPNHQRNYELNLSPNVVLWLVGAALVVVGLMLIFGVITLPAVRNSGARQPYSGPAIIITTPTPVPGAKPTKTLPPLGPPISIEIGGGSK